MLPVFVVEMPVGDDEVGIALVEMVSEAPLDRSVCTLVREERRARHGPGAAVQMRRA